MHTMQVGMVLVVDTLSRAPRSEETGISMIKYQPTANANHLCCNCGYILLGRMYTIYIYYSDKHTNALEAMQISSPNLSEGSSLRLPITITSKMSVYSSYIEA